MLGPCSAPSRLQRAALRTGLVRACARRSRQRQAGTKKRHSGTNKETGPRGSNDSAEVCERKRRDGGRSSRRARTLVPEWPNRGRSANQIARALISMMARSNQLQSEAEHVDLRPLSLLDDPSCDARPDLHLGHEHALLRASCRSAASSEAAAYIGFFRSASII
jgi:hypothetical protein